MPQAIMPNPIRYANISGNVRTVIPRAKKNKGKKSILKAIHVSFRISFYPCKMHFKLFLFTGFTRKRYPF